MRRRFVRLACVPLLVLATAAGPTRPNDLDALFAGLDKSTSDAERKCLSGSTTTTTAAVSSSATLSAFRRAFLGGEFNAGASATRKTEILRGAASELPAALRTVADDKIRKCLQDATETYTRFMAARLQQLAADAVASAVGRDIEFDFAFERTVSADAALYDPNELRLLVIRQGQTPRSHIIAMDDGDPKHFYATIPVPGDREVLRGLITPLPKQSRLASSTIPETNFCLARGPMIDGPPPAAVEWFSCREKQGCKPHALSSRALVYCPIPPVAEGPARFRYAAATGDSVHWEVPALASLSHEDLQGSGFTSFTVRTSAFQQPGIDAVEVALKVNGTEVWEDGLPPPKRPVDNDPGHPFTYSFALQALNFEGANDGCERIELTLTPAGPVAAAPVHASMPYVAFRDVLPQAAEGAPTLTWSASYITPKAEWRSMAVLNSYLFDTAKPAQRHALLARAKDDKKWLDGLGLVYQNEPIVGIIRPPWTIRPNGVAAYGLVVGLRQPDGRTRFTFSDADSSTLVAFVARSAHGARASYTISKIKDPLSLASGRYTLPGLCS